MINVRLKLIKRIQILNREFGNTKHIQYFTVYLIDKTKVVECMLPQCFRVYRDLNLHLKALSPWL